MDVEALAETQPLHDRIHHFLLRGHKTTEEIIEALGAEPRDVRTTLSNDRHKQFMMNNGPDGQVRWALITLAEPF